MATAAQVIATARGYQGTRWQHQGRQPGVGLDCGGVVICALATAGLPVVDRRGYGRLADPALMRAVMESVLVRVPRGEPWRPADVLWLRFPEPQHVALWTGRTVIHAYAQVRKVVEHRLDATWRRRVVAVYRHPGVRHVG